MPFVKRTFEAAAIAEAKQLYEDTPTPMKSIAALLGVSTATLRNRAKEWSWTPRRSDPRVSAPAPPTPVAPPAANGPLDRAALVMRMQAAIEHELNLVDSIVATLGPSSHEEAERAARTLATLARSLREVMRLDAPPAPTEPTDDIPRDLNELRRELSYKLAAIVAGREGAVPGGP
jgi:hypothetical protein